MHASISSPASLGRGIVILLAVAAGLGVASIYYNQPMLGILAKEFHVGVGSISLIPVMTQVGYAAGLLLLTPLGDRYERRRLLVVNMFGLAVTLAMAAMAGGFAAMVAASLGVGLLATVAQQIIPMAAQLAPEHERGRVVGLVMAGLLSGILLARTVSGFVSEFINWRMMFGLASAASLVFCVVLSRTLPKVQPATAMSYPQLLWSLVDLMRKYRVLRQAGMVQGLLFAGFVAYWASLALYLEQPPFELGSSVAGLLGIVGVVGVLAAPLAGRLADKGGQGLVIRFGAACAAVSFLLFALCNGSMIVMVIGIILLDIGMQAAMVSNQTRVYALDAAARSRLNTVYMTMMFTAGALGTALGGLAFALFGWTGVCVMGAACSLLALAVEISSPKS